MEVNLGLVPDMGLSVALPRLLREDVAMELTLSGRVVGGREAHELGLLTRLAERPREAALELAAEIAARSPDAVRAIKRLFGEAWSAPPEPSLKLETALMESLIGTPNQLEAMRAARDGDAAAFVDP